MIFDRLENLAKFACIPRVEAIVGFISSMDVYSLQPGSVPIQGDDLFVKVLEYAPKPAAENNFETHKYYADVQVIFRGIEQMQITGPDNLSPVGPYDAEQDFQFFNAQKDISNIIIKEKEFLVFSPGEVHKPGCYYRDQEGPVLKLVFKTKMSESGQNRVFE